MYEPGDLRVDPPCEHAKDEFGYCAESKCDSTSDSRGLFGPLYGMARLPHSCDSWVIGGPAEIEALIKDLTDALSTMKKGA